MNGESEAIEVPRPWTLDEANAALAEVSALVSAAMTAWQEGDRAAVGTIARDLAGRGVVLRDIETGLIDFVGIAPSGRPYFLCWMWGEPEIDTWHWPEDGFSGRTPVTEPPD